MIGLSDAEWASWAYYVALACTVGAVFVPLLHSIFFVPRSVLGALYGAAATSVGALLAYALSTAEPAGVTQSLGVQLTALAATLLFSMAFGILLPAVCDKMWRAKGVRDGVRLIFPTALFGILALLIVVAQPLPSRVALQTYTDPVKEEIARVFTAEAELRVRVEAAIDRRNHQELCRVADDLRHEAQRRASRGKPGSRQVSMANARLATLEQAGMLPFRSAMRADESIEACELGQAWEGINPTQLGQALASIADVLDTPALRPRLIDHPKAREGGKATKDTPPDDRSGHSDGDSERSLQQDDEGFLASSRPSILLASWRIGRDLVDQAAHADAALPEDIDGSMILLVLSQASLIVLALALAGTRTMAPLDQEG